MITTSSLINHKQGRARLQEFLEDEMLRLCVITAPAHYGKSTLCDWLYAHVTQRARIASFVQLNTLLKPPAILKAILTDLNVPTDSQHHMQACRPSAPVSVALVQDVQVINAQSITIQANSKAPSENDHSAYYSDLFDAFVQDLGASKSFVLVIDNYEKCDELVQRWIYTCLLKLVKLVPAIKVVFFCQQFEKANLELPVARLSREYRLLPIVDPEEVYEWLREHGQNISEQIVNAVANAFDNYGTEPLVMANALKILLPRPPSSRQSFHEVLPP